MAEMIKENDNKFLSKFVTKDTNPPSFRVYYGGIPIAVPFIWEAKPGTPKHPNSTLSNNNTSLPPLTPPPSYSYNTKKTVSPSNSKKGNKMKMKMIIFQGLFPKMMSIRHRRQISFASSSSSSSSSTTLSSSSSSSLDSEEVTARDSPRSILCFAFAAGKN